MGLPYYDRLMTNQTQGRVRIRLFPCRQPIDLSAWHTAQPV